MRIARHVKITSDLGAEQRLGEDELTQAHLPLVILGEPGIGKTDLSRRLAQTFGAEWRRAGALAALPEVSLSAQPRGAVWAVDGLDEVSAQGGQSTVDVILGRLLAMGATSFILSCRSADWEAAAGAHKIETDFGRAPTVVHLEPFTREEAKTCLQALPVVTDPSRLLGQLDAQGLSDFYGNPLTLELLAEIDADGGGLPDQRAKLFAQASALLVQERNRLHGDRRLAQTHVESLLDAAGAIFATLLLTGEAGVSLRPAHETPAGFIPFGELGPLPEPTPRRDILGTRLFRGDGEGLFVPVHRVVAEYLGARWLAQGLERKSAERLSARRVRQALTWAGGVPTALRGLHAWIAHFSPTEAPRCIDADPYGVLRYGDVADMATPLVRRLIERLVQLADEDPYFRTDDWSRRSAHGLVRPELLPDLFALLRSPSRHFHLNTLILEAMRGSGYVAQHAAELVAIAQDERATFAERRRALEAASPSLPSGRPAEIVAALRRADTEDSRRLAVEFIELRRGEGFSDDECAGAYLQFEGLIGPSALREDEDEDEAEARHHKMSGAGIHFAEALPPERAAGVLDALADKALAKLPAAHWEVRFGIAYAVRHLMARIDKAERPPAPARAWRWIRMLKADQEYSSGDDRPPVAWASNPEWRRALQAIVLRDATVDAPFYAAYAVLQRSTLGLRLTEADAAWHVDGLAAQAALSDADLELWDALLRVSYSRKGRTPTMSAAARRAVARHARLAPSWAVHNAKPDPDYVEQERARRRRAETKRVHRLHAVRRKLRPHIEAIRAGTDLGLLGGAAKTRLRARPDMPKDLDEAERLVAWLGPDLAEACSAGLAAALSKPGLPSAKDIADAHADRKYWPREVFLKAGLLEYLRRHGDLAGLSESVLQAALAAFWQDPTLKPPPELVAAVFRSRSAAEGFLRTLVEPKLAADPDYLDLEGNLRTAPALAPLVADLAVGWLMDYPTLRPDSQMTLVQLVTGGGQGHRLAPVADSRLASPLDDQLRRMWLAVTFVALPPAAWPPVAKAAAVDPELIWAIHGLFEREPPDRQAHVERLAFIVETFGPHWPQVDSAAAGWGSSPAWSASNFIVGCLNLLAEQLTSEAGQALDRLARAAPRDYQDPIAHARARQARRLRDRSFAPLSRAAALALLTGQAPQTIDDLRAIVLDQFEAFQARILSSSGDDWKIFWDGDTPHSEEWCRDRLFALLQGYMPPEIQLAPESLMPNRKRADGVAVIGAMGLPIEIKGQWHPEVWTASELQLIDLYAFSWRAEGRGVYLVFWFGPVAGKNLPSLPGGGVKPVTPVALRQRLIDELPAPHRDLIDVIVLDVDGRARATATKAAKRRK